MKTRSIVTSASILVCLAGVTGVLIQHRQVIKLREERQPLNTQTEHANQNSLPAPAPQLQNRLPAAHRPSLELVRLRGQVAQLMARQRELASVLNENQKLRDQVSAQSTNPVQVPPGYLRKSQLKMAGLKTPEDTFQTFMWAIHNRDSQKIVEVLTPQAVQKFQNQIERAGSVEALFDEHSVIPGFRILERKPQEDGSVRLKVEIIPGQPHSSNEIPLQLINGEWKLDFF